MYAIACARVESVVFSVLKIDRAERNVLGFFVTWKRRRSRGSQSALDFQCSLNWVMRKTFSSRHITARVKCLTSEREQEPLQKRLPLKRMTTTYAFSFPEPTILLVCARDRSGEALGTRMVRMLSDAQYAASHPRTPRGS